MAIVCFDVDGTLLQNASGADVPRPNVIALLKLLSKKGNHIIVWSGGGAEYAATQCRRLKIDKWVTQYCSKQDAPNLDVFLAIDDQDVNLGKYNIRV